MPYQSKKNEHHLPTHHVNSAALLKDQRPSIVSQLKLQQFMDDSPSMVAQRKLQRQMNADTGNKNAVIQPKQKDVGIYIFNKRNQLKTIDGLNDIFVGCYDKRRLMTKWFNEKGELVTLKQYLIETTNKEWTEGKVSDPHIPAKYRKALLEEWNREQSEELKLSQDLIADLVQDVATLELGEKVGLKRSDSFTFGEETKVPDFGQLLKQLNQTVKVEDGSKSLKKVPSTKSLRTSGLLIRAYGDDLNKDHRKPGTEFVLDLGGSLGIYRDAYGNGDMFYYPIETKESEPDIFLQEGGSSEHTWTSLAEQLSKNSALEGLSEKLAKVLLSEYEGKLNRSEVNAIGAMLADAKLSIQGWVYAVEQLKSFKLKEKTINDLFAVIGLPFWRYSLNASHLSNRDIDENKKGRKAGLGYKEEDKKRKRNSDGSNSRVLNPFKKKKKDTEVVNQDK